jgi:hypothetical protein
VLRAGGYNVGCVRAQDYELWLRLSRLGDLDNCTEPLVQYRRHPAQHSRPIVGDNAHLIRVARRGAAGSGRVAAIAADARHLAWLSVQVAKAWRHG